jgi:UDP-N-acetyl-2-amino-2-deoxyglucuronate dehydrogenase
MAAEKIRIGLIGCGRISGNHIQAMRDHADACELVAVCDTERTRAAEKAAETGVPA